MSIGQGCAQNRLSTKQCALAQKLQKVFECGGALPKKRHPEAQQWNVIMSRRTKTTPRNTRNPRQQTLLTRVCVSSGDALAISVLVVALPLVRSISVGEHLSALRRSARTCLCSFWLA